MRADFATDDPIICGVCRRRAVALAYRPSAKSPLMWLCEHNDCHSLAKEVYRMAQDRLDIYERSASLKAGEEIGIWLDSIKKTDLAQLTAHEWDEFCHRFVIAYTDELRRTILLGGAPF